VALASMMNAANHRSQELLLDGRRNRYSTLTMILPKHLILAAAALTTLLGTARADGLVIPDVSISLKREGDTLTLSWSTLSVITNAGRTPIFPLYVVEASTDMLYWWQTTVVIPQRVGGAVLTIQTNFIVPSVLPVAFVRLRSELELEGANLSDADFRGVDFSGLNLEHTQFHRSLLSGARFTDCRLAYAEFLNVVADTADFDAADATRLQANHADFRGANWAHAKLESAMLDGADFEGANLNHARLQEASARDASFNSCSFNDSNLIRAMCDGASFVKAELTDADVSYLSCVNGNLENVDFDECYGEYANFQGAIMKKSSIRDSDFSATDFRSVNFSDSEFELTDFRFADFRGADMDDVTAYFCDFTGAQFWGAP
jgi:uncharacterized protein YjbI with pentapeptide repeats